jgi:endonuclease/exonuclease/phosphatase family metal-dependent hydrolase
MRTLSRWAPALPLALVFLTAAYSGPGAAPAQDCSSNPCIQIGTFNIEWLGASNESMHPHRTREQVRRIGALIANTLDLEIVVLEEINTESAEYGWLREYLTERGYRLRAGEAGGEQRVVIAYDDDEVDLLPTLGGDGIRELPVQASFNYPDGCRSEARRPLAGHFRAGQFRFLLVGVHLKSQRDGECGDRIRTVQTTELFTAVQRLRSESGERDVIIAGDFNSRLSNVTLAPLLGAPGFRALTTAERRASGSPDISYLKAPYQELIDHLVVDIAATREWVPRSTTIYRVPTSPSARAAYLRTISDHAPVWASFATSTDAG